MIVRLLAKRFQNVYFVARKLFTEKRTGENNCLHLEVK